MRFIQKTIIVVIFCIIANTGFSLDKKQPDTDSKVVQQKKIHWYRNYAEGMQVAEREKMPVLIDFYADWCGPCKQMDREVFANADIIKRLEKFVCIKVNTDKDPATSLAWRVRSMPRTIYLNTSKQVIGDQSGYGGLTKFKQVLSMAEELKDKTLEEADKAPKTQSEKEMQLVDKTLKKLETPKEINAAIKLLANKDKEIRKRTTTALDGIKEKSIPLILKTLNSEYLGQRIGSCEALKKITKKEIIFDPWAEKAIRDEAIKKLHTELQK